VSEILLVDAFARRPFEGNQAAVVLLDGPADEVLANPEMADLYFGGSVRHAPPRAAV